MLILPAEADEKVVGTAVDRITKAIEPSGGSVLNIDRWGRRRFAFEVDRQSEGYYVVVAFDAEPAVVAPLERALVLADEVMRAKVTIRHPQQPGRRSESAPSSGRTTSRTAETPAAAAPAEAPQPTASAPEPPADEPQPAAEGAEGASPETSDEAASPAPA
jgi:small subunit ribosomal protein S6